MRGAVPYMVAVGLTIVACSAPVEPGPPTNPGLPGNGGGVGGRRDAGTADGGLPDGGQRPSGFVRVTSTFERVPPSDQLQSSWFATARFTANPAAPQPGCVEDAVGNACVTRTCQGPGLQFDGGMPGPQRHAGTITVLGGITAVELVPTDGGYGVVQGQPALFSGGETLQFSATGGDVPAFNATLTAPSRTVVSVGAADGGIVPVDRATGLQLTWQATLHGELHVILQTDDAIGSTTPTEQEIVHCRFPAAGGSGFIPAEALSVLRPGEGLMSFDVVAEETLRVGDWDVTVFASHSGVTLGERGVIGIEVD